MKHLFSGLIFIKYTAVLALVISLVACGGAEERKVKYLEKGKTYLAEKNYDKARVEIKNVLQIDPKFAEAYFIMGKLEEANKELGKALGNYRKAVELDPQYVEAKIKLAKIYVVANTEKMISDASSLLAEVKKVDPENPQVALIAATIKYKAGSKQEATQDLQAVVAKHTNLVDGISLLSTIYLANNEEAKAVKLLTQGVANNPESIMLRISLAKILAKNKDLSGAEKYLKQAINLDPEKYGLQVALSSFYASSNQVDKAEAVLRKAIAQDGDEALRYLMLVEMLASRVSVKEAEEELSKAIQSKPDLYDLKFSQVKFYEKIGNRDKLKQVLEQIIKEKSHDVEGVKARNLLAKYLLEEGDQKAAKKYVDEVIAEYPNDGDALLITAKLSLMNLDAVSAINGLRTVVKNDPKNTEASLLLAQAHEMNKESALAENELKKSIEVNPLDEKVHANYARYLGSRGRVDEAVDVVDKALTYFKDSYDLMSIKLKIVASQKKETEMLALLNMMEQADSARAEVNLAKGHYFFSKGKMPQAIEQFEIAYQKSQDKFKPLQLIVRTYMSNKQAEKAIERLKKNLDKNPDDAIANLLLGQVLLLQKKVPEAREKFLLASKAAESWLLPYTNLVASYMAENEIDKALAVYVDALGKLKNKVPVQLQIASIYEKKKDFSTAMKKYQEILAVHSGNKLAANNYASLLLDHGTEESDVAKALELSKDFEKLRQPAFLDTLAWAYSKSGNNAKAIELLKPIVEKAPEIAVFRYHLGFALYQSGDKAAAKSHLELAVNSNQSYYGKDKAIELLKTL